jgi:hypothetical protein
VNTLIKRVILDERIAETLESEHLRPQPDETPVITRSVLLGLGDQVYRVAHPIGCWLDRLTAKLGGRMAWAKTGLCGCSACSARRRRLNALVPDVRRWKGGWKVACTRIADALQRRLRGRV